MKKKVLTIISCLMFLILITSCSGPKWLQWIPWIDSDDSISQIESTTKDESLINYKVEITISKFGDSNDLQDIDNNQIVTPTTESEFSIKGLTQNKMVLVKVNFIVSNKADNDYYFEPYFIIGNSKGYELEKASNDSADITTKNQGTNDEYIEVNGLSKSIRAGELNKSIPYIFVYECKQNSNYLYTNQEWAFFDKSNNNKLIHNVNVQLSFPTNYEKILEPNFIYNDNTIDVEINDSNVKYADVVCDNKLKSLSKVNDKYKIEINKSGKYTLKLRSSDLLTEDYTCDFDVKVLDNVSNLSLNEDKTISFSKQDLATFYEIIIKDSNGNIKDEFNVINTDNIDIANRVSSYEKGEYTLNVYANSSDNLVFKSINASTIKFKKLDEPSISTKGHSITWQSVTGATKYIIYKNNEVIAETTELSYSDRSFEMYDKVYVIAVSDFPNYFNSGKSNIEIITTA